MSIRAHQLMSQLFHKQFKPKDSLYQLHQESANMQYMREKANNTVDFHVCRHPHMQKENGLQATNTGRENATNGNSSTAIELTIEFKFQ